MPTAIDYVLALTSGGIQGYRQKQALQRELAEERRRQLMEDKRFAAEENYRDRSLELQERGVGLQEEESRFGRGMREKEFTREGEQFGKTYGFQEKELGQRGSQFDRELALRYAQLKQEGDLGRMTGAINIGRGGSGRIPTEQELRLKAIMDISGPPTDIEILRAGSFEEAIRQRLELLQNPELGLFNGAAAIAPSDSVARIKNPQKRKVGDSLGLRR